MVRENWVYSKVIKKMPKDELPEVNSNSQTCRQYFKSCISYRACIQNTKTKTSLFLIRKMNLFKKWANYVNRYCKDYSSDGRESWQTGLPQTQRKPSNVQPCFKGRFPQRSNSEVCRCGAALPGKVLLHSTERRSHSRDLLGRRNPGLTARVENGSSHLNRHRAYIGLLRDFRVGTGQISVLQTQIG